MLFRNNGDPRCNTRSGVYEEGCGLRSVHISRGHGEYVYHILKDYLPVPALYMVRCHSFYAWHYENECGYLCGDHDREMLFWVRKLNPYDLYL